MLRRSAIIAVVIAGTIGAWADGGQVPAKTEASSSAKAPDSKANQKKAKSAKARKPVHKKQAEQLPPPPPPPPPTLEQQPAVAPEVLYRGGTLTILAKNSTMGDILSAVRRVTGAEIDRPPGGGSERVVGQYGPGQPREVLDQLLDGSRYDYIILGSLNRPGAVERVVLSARGNQAPRTAVATNNPAQPAQPVAGAQAGEEQDEPEVDNEDMSVPEQPQQEPAQVQPQPGQQPPPDQNQPNQQENQPKVKSPEELLRELQQMQQQQQPQQQPPPDQEPQ